MIVNKHLICQTVIVPYMENTNSDILGLGITSLVMWISNRGHVFRVGGIILHLTGVFSNVLMQKKRHYCQKTSDWSNSDCSVHGKYRQRYITDINVDIEPWSRLPYWRHQNVLMQKKRHESRTTSDLSKSDCSVHDSDITVHVTIKVFEMKFCIDV